MGGRGRKPRRNPSTCMHPQPIRSVPTSRTRPRRPAAQTRRPPGAASADGTTATVDEPAARGESVSRAYDQLRELIVWGRLAPGTRIVESEVARRLGVSRTPVRSALHRLQQEGYVVPLDRTTEQRLVVAPLTQQDSRELFLIVGQLEGLAARTAAELPAKERGATATRLKGFNAELAQVARASRPDPLRIFDLDTAFHHAFVEDAGGPRLLALHDAIKPQCERYIRLYISSLVDEIDTSVAEHAVIMRHIKDGEPIAAQGAVETNWRNAAARLGKVINTFGERGHW